MTIFRLPLTNLGDSLFFFASEGIYQVLEPHPFKLVGLVTNSLQEAVGYFFARLVKKIRPDDTVNGDWIYTVSHFNNLLSNSIQLRRLAQQGGFLKGHKSTNGLYISQGQAYIRLNTDLILEKAEEVKEKLSEFTFYEVKEYKDILERVLCAREVSLEDVKILKGSGYVKHGPYKNGLSVFLSFKDGRVINSGPDYLQFIPRRSDSWIITSQEIRRKIVEKVLTTDDFAELPLYIIHRGEYAIYYNPGKDKFETELYEELINLHSNVRDIEEIIDSLNQEQLKIIKEVYQLKTIQEAALVYIYKILARRN